MNNCYIQADPTVKERQYTEKHLSNSSYKEYFVDKYQ